MNRKIRVIFTSFLLLVGVCLGGMPLYAAAAPGETCRTAIPLGDNYEATITGPSTIWYTAWTFDLPIKMCFTPDDPSALPPEVAMDFSCISGYYEDSILCSLFCKTGGNSGIVMEMPHKPTLQYEDGAWCISMGEKYRDLLLRMGISYNLEVFVQVTFKCSGVLSMLPDTEFSDCMDGGKFLQYGDTVLVKAKDDERYVIVPYVQWQEDSIRYIWKGTTPLTLAVSGKKCNFDPVGDDFEGYILQRAVIQPGDTLRVISSQISHYVHFENNVAGMFYAKFYSEEPGVLKVEKAPLPPPDGGAVLLKFDHKETIFANDSSALYAMPKSWTQDIQFSAPTAHLMSMYVSPTADFTPSTAYKAYTMLKKDDTRWIGIPKSEMQELWNAAGDNYIYVRFFTTARTNVTPSQWYPSDCYNSTMGIEPDTTFRVVKNSPNIYRLYYGEIAGGDLAFAMNQNISGGCKILLSYECEIETSITAENLLWNGELTKKNEYETIPAATVAEWKSKIGSEGYLYARFAHKYNMGTNITMVSTRPAEVDPTYPASSIAVACVNNNPAELSVSVSESQHIVLKDVVDAVVDEWDAVPGESYTLHLSKGLYALTGLTQTIKIMVP